MKITIVSLFSLLVGIGAGWYVGSRPSSKVERHTRELQEAIVRIGNVQEVDQAAAASFAVDAIRCIDSGETQKAVQFLSFPIAMYYRDYGTQAGTTAERLKLGAAIEQLAQTNPFVAARIKASGSAYDGENIK